MGLDGLVRIPVDSAAVERCEEIAALMGQRVKLIVPSEEDRYGKLEEAPSFERIRYYGTGLKPFALFHDGNRYYLIDPRQTQAVNSRMEIPEILVLRTPDEGVSRGDKALKYE